MKKFFVR